MKDLPKIALITYFYPPANDVAAGRVFHFAKYLSRQGFDVDVYTVEKDGRLFENFGYNPIGGERVNVEEIAYPFVNIYKKGFFCGRLMGQRWYQAILAVVRAVISLLWCLKVVWQMKSAGEYSAIVSSYGPSTCSIIGRFYKMIYPSIPWIHDYRDYWCSNGAYDQESWLRCVAQLNFRSVERWCVSKASCITTVSEGLATNFEQFGKRVEIIFNGYEGEIRDPVDANCVEGANEVRFLYTGIFYPGFRDASFLIDVLARLKTEGKLPSNVRFDIIGTYSTFSSDIRKAKELGVSDVITFGGKVPRDECIRRQSEADYLLFFDWRDEEEQGNLSGKCFEYISSGKPIVSIDSPKDSKVAALLRDTKTGIALDQCIEKCADQLEKLFVKGDRPWFAPDSEKISVYSRDRQSYTLLEIVKQLTSKPQD